MVMIRKANADDLGDILALNKAFFQYETKFNDEYNLAWADSDECRENFIEQIKSDDSIVLVAEIDKKTVGFSVSFIETHTFRATNPILEIENLFLLAEYRGKGIGKKLFEETQKIAKEKGVKRIKAEVVANNKDAITFYKSCGFEDFDVILEKKLD